jgi:hypothetical protein
MIYGDLRDVVEWRDCVYDLRKDYLAYWGTRDLSHEEGIVGGAGYCNIYDWIEIPSYGRVTLFFLSVENASASSEEGKAFTTPRKGCVYHLRNSYLDYLGVRDLTDSCTVDGLTTSYEIGLSKSSLSFNDKLRIEGCVEP